VNIYKLTSYIVISNIRSYSLVFSIFYLILFTQYAIAQNFTGAIHGGMNLTQLTGDNLSGFNTIGLHSGLSISYPIGSDKKEIAMEMLYNRKGSNDSNPVSGLNQSIQLDYLSIPILYRWGEWFNETKGYYNFYLELGPVINRLFSANSSNTFYDDLTDQFNKWDLGLTGGINARISSKVSATIRYERSINKIYSLDGSNLRGLQSYLISTRLDYTL